IVGQQEETALGMLTTALISLAAQLPAREPTPDGSATFYVLDGSQPDAPDAGLLARLPDLLPQPVRLAGWRHAPAPLAEQGAEGGAGGGGGPRAEGGGQGGAADLPGAVRPAALPRPAPPGGRLQLPAQGRRGGEPAAAVRDAAARGGDPGRPHADLVRHAEQPAAGDRPAGAARAAAAGGPADAR